MREFLNKCDKDTQKTKEQRNMQLPVKIMSVVEKTEMNEVLASVAKIYNVVKVGGNIKEMATFYRAAGVEVFTHERDNDILYVEVRDDVLETITCTCENFEPSFLFTEELAAMKKWAETEEAPENEDDSHTLIPPNPMKAVEEDEEEDDEDDRVEVVDEAGDKIKISHYTNGGYHCPCGSDEMKEEEQGIYCASCDVMFYFPDTAKAVGRMVGKQPIHFDEPEITEASFDMSYPLVNDDGFVFAVIHTDNGIPDKYVLVDDTFLISKSDVPLHKVPVIITWDCDGSRSLRFAKADEEGFRCPECGQDVYNKRCPTCHIDFGLPDAGDFAELVGRE